MCECEATGEQENYKDVVFVRITGPAKILSSPAGLLRPEVAKTGKTFQQLLLSQIRQLQTVYTKPNSV